MPAFVLVTIIASAAALGVSAWLLLAGPAPVRERSVGNLNRGLGEPQLAIGSSRPAARSALVGWLATPARRRRIQRLLGQAGHPEDWTVDKVIAAKLLLTAVMGGLAALMIPRTENTLLQIAMVGFIVLAFFVPEILLYNRGLKRREVIDLELADVLDQMSIAVSAGLGFDSAMLRVARNGRGVLAGELLRTMQDLRVGQSRRHAYDDLSERTGSIPLRRFMRSVVQAEAYGIALSDVLHTQADEMRKTRRQNAERKAMEIPVKVTIPLILTILPVLFIVVLGPAAINIIAMFSGM